MSTATQAVIRRLAAALNAGRPDAGLDVWAADLLFNGQRVNPQDIAQIRAPLWAAVPDLQWQLERLIVEGEWAAVHWTMHGTHTGAFAHPRLGTAPASGKPIRLAYMDHYRVQGDHITEAWEVRDGLALQQQLGVRAASAAPPA